MDLNNSMQTEEDLRCMKIGSHRAHQQAITVLDSEGGRVLTGSQDHTLKVYRYAQSNEQYYMPKNLFLYIYLIQARRSAAFVHASRALRPDIVPIYRQNKSYDIW